MLQECVNTIKSRIESAIRTASFNGDAYANGQKAKEALIRSQELINLLHENIKQDLVNQGIPRERIVPTLGLSSPEMKISGFFKQKDQDVCVIPQGIMPHTHQIVWGPLQYETNPIDNYGPEFSQKTLAINVRSQLSSIAKNADTLFERTFAESINLHMQYPGMVLGEVYLIPVYEYDDSFMLNNVVRFKTSPINISKFISFFNTLNNRNDIIDEYWKYERVALIIVDFSQQTPQIYHNTQELIANNLVPQHFPLDYSSLSYDTFTRDLLAKYNERFNNHPD